MCMGTIWTVSGMLFNHIILNSAKNFIEKYQTAGAAAICNGLLAVVGCTFDACVVFGAGFFVGDVGGADFSCYCSEVAVVNSALPLLQDFFYIIAASDKSLTHTKVAEDVDQAFTARP